MRCEKGQDDLGRCGQSRASRAWYLRARVCPQPRAVHPLLITSTRINGSCAIWVCIGSGSSSSRKPVKQQQDSNFHHQGVLTAPVTGGSFMKLFNGSNAGHWRRKRVKCRAIARASPLYTRGSMATGLVTWLGMDFRSHFRIFERPGIVGLLLKPTGRPKAASSFCALLL